MPRRPKYLLDTVARLERGEKLARRTLAAIRAALEAAGVEFTNGNQPGVKLREWPAVSVFPCHYDAGRAAVVFDVARKKVIIPRAVFEHFEGHTITDAEAEQAFNRERMKFQEAAVLKCRQQRGHKIEIILTVQDIEGLVTNP